MTLIFDSGKGRSWRAVVRFLPLTYRTGWKIAKALNVAVICQATMTLIFESRSGVRIYKEFSLGWG